MDVYVIPIGPDRYELYCERPPDTDADAEAPASGLVGRIKQRVATFLRSAEQRHQAPPDPQTAANASPSGLFARLNDRMMAWVAERVAEQRLLWTLRGNTAATAVYPDDLTFDQVQTLIQRTLQRDYERHRRWMWIDGFLFLLTFITLAPIFIIIPGVANIPALFFGFRTISHWFSRGGARHGLQAVTWTGRPCAPLTELRQAATQPEPVRSERVADVARALRLPHLARFYERVAVE
jgi:hypothetical protein